jgi:hypothetical protein
MSSGLIASFLNSFNHSIVFGTLIGLESLFLVARAPKRRLLPLWSVLLPLLCAAAFIDHRLIALLRSLNYEYLFPFFTTLVAAAGASFIMMLIYRTHGEEANSEANLLVFASIAALFMALPWWTPGTGGVHQWLSSAFELWAGYGTALLCFAALGPRLFNRGSSSGLFGCALFFVSVVMIGVALSGIQGLQLFIFQK